MIEEQAQVIDIKGTRLFLQVQTQSACGGCAVNKSCGTSVLAKVVGKKFTHFQAENNIGAEIGDTVVVGIAEDALLKGSMVMYVLPVLAMIIFALLADFLLAGPLQIEASVRDLAVACTSIMGLVLGSLVARWYFRRQSSVAQFMPVVLRKIISHE